jgi:hypothetical protein
MKAWHLMKKKNRMAKWNTRGFMNIVDIMRCIER